MWGLKLNYLTFFNLNVDGVSIGVQDERGLVVVLDVWSSHGSGFYRHLGWLQIQPHNSDRGIPDSYNRIHRFCSSLRYRMQGEEADIYTSFPNSRVGMFYASCFCKLFFFSDFLNV